MRRSARNHDQGKNYPYTGVPGPSFHMRTDVTKGRMYDIIRDFAAKLGPGYVLDLEPITEGGIIFRSWPGKDPEKNKKQYKTIRFNCADRKWPMIEPDVTLRDWNLPGERDVVVYPSEVYGVGQMIHTFLKAYYGAPCWTLKELNALSAVLRDHGLFLVKGRKGSSDVPKKFATSTISYGKDLGGSLDVE